MFDNILIASKNRHKITEIKYILKNISNNFCSLKDIKNLPDIDETGKTFFENSLLKSIGIYNYSKIPAIGDDSGLVIPILNGEPGIYSARYAGENSTQDMLINKVLIKLKNIKEKDRIAFFHTTITIAFKKNDINEHLFNAYKNKKILHEHDGILYITSDGRVEGKINFSPIGNMGFGYDPIFIPKGYSKTFSEMSEEEKNSISHRKNALANLVDMIIE